MRYRFLAPLTLFAVAVVVPDASAAAKLPVVTGVAPKKVAIGKTLTVRGRNFVKGKKKNTVVFQRTKGGRYVFVRSSSATTRSLKVLVPSKLTASLDKSKGKRISTRFRLRVLARRFGARFTSKALSPVVMPSSATTGDTPTTCSGAQLSPTGDGDKDHLSNSLEQKLHTDPCLADTDGDKVPDFYEYEAGLDYNSLALPYPGKRPYPNALDPTDVNVDHDSDGLPLWAEYLATKKFGTPGDRNLFLSDGTQNSMEAKPGFGYQGAGSRHGQVPAPTPDAAHPWYLDTNGNGWLSDDERDADGDGLGNWDEFNGRMTPAWWKAAHEDEPEYTLSRYTGTDWLDFDTDGDGVGDGRDDIDHDGWANWREIDRFHANFQAGQPRPVDGAYGPYGYWTQPFNPCLPDYTGNSAPDPPPHGANPRGDRPKHHPFP